MVFMYCVRSIDVSIASNINFMKRNRSYKKILNKSGPRIERCDTPNNISSQELNVLSLFLHADLCLYDNYGATLKVVYQNHMHVISLSVDH